MHTASDDVKSTCNKMLIIFVVKDFFMKAVKCFEFICKQNL